MPRLAALTVAASLFLSLSASAQCPTDDDNGVNDTCAGAILLPIGPSVYPGVTIDAAGNGAAEGAGDDWFGFNIGPGETVSVTLVFDHAAGDLDMGWRFGACGQATTVQSISSPNFNAEQFFITSGPGASFSVLFRVFMVDTGGCNDWTLYVDYGPTCDPNTILEPNDTCGAAWPVSDASGVVLTVTGMTTETVDEDWYTVALPPQSALSASLFSEPGQGNANLQLVAACGAVLDETVDLAYQESTFYFNSSASTEHVQMRVYLATGGCVENSINYIITPCSGLDDGFEPNNTCPEATVLPLATTVTVPDRIVKDNGGDGPFPDSGDDHWQYVIPPFSQLDIELTYNAPMPPVVVQLRDASCATLSFVQSTNAPSSKHVRHLNTSSSNLTVNLGVAEGALNGCRIYDMVFESSARPCLALSDDIYEPNDLTTTPTPRPGDSTTSAVIKGDNRDYFSVVVPAGATQEVDLFFLHSVANLEMVLFAFSPYEVLGSATSMTDNESFVITNLGTTDREYVIEVFRDLDSADACSDYTMQLTQTLDPCFGSDDDAYEPNDSCNAGPLVGENSILSNLRAFAGQEDWYAIDVPAGSTQTIESVFGNSSDVALFTARDTCVGGSPGTLAFFTTSGGQSSFSFTNGGASAATYYFGFLLSGDFGTCADYMVTLTNTGQPMSIVPYCFGDGSQVNCPCNNNSSAGHPGGCAHQNGDGAVLVGSGTPSLSADSLHFDLSSAVQNSFALLVSGMNQLPQTGCLGCGIPAFDGLRCAGGDFLRHGSRALNASGTANNGWGPPAGPSGGLGALSNVIAGQTRNYFAFFRTDIGSSCMTGQNSSNGVAVTWAP